MVAALNPPQLESEEMSRIMALCKRAYSAESSVGDMPGLMEEVSVDYLRTMNKIVLEAQTKEVTIQYLFGLAGFAVLPMPNSSAWSKVNGEENGQGVLFCLLKSYKLVEPKARLHVL